MSYVLKQSRLFERDNDKWKKLIPKCRPEYKMKEYDSSEDLRSWSVDPEENRRWFYEKAGPGPKPKTSYFGSVIPFQTVLDIVLSDVKSISDDLKHYRSLPLTDDQLRLLEEMRAGRGPDKDGDGLHVLKKLEGGPTEESTAWQPSLYEDDNRDLVSESQVLLQPAMSLDTCQRKLVDLQEQITSLEQENSRLQDSLQEKEKLMQELKTELEEYREEMAQTLDQQKDLEDLIREKNALADKVEELSGIATVNGHLKLKLKDYEKLRDERDILRIRLDKFKQLELDLNMYKDRACEAALLRLERDRLQKQVDKLSAFPMALQDALNRLDAEVEQKDHYRRRLAEVLYLEKVNESLREKLARTMETNSKLMNELRKLMNEKIQLVNEKSKLMNEINKCECNIDTLIIESEELKKDSVTIQYSRRYIDNVAERDYGMQLEYRQSPMREEPTFDESQSYHQVVVCPRRMEQMQNFICKCSSQHIPY